MFRLFPIVLTSTFLLTLCATLSGQAATYQAYHFENPKLDERADLQPLKMFRDVEISNATATTLVKLTVDGVDWTVTPETADFLQRASAPFTILPLPAPLQALAAGAPVTLDSTTLSSPRGQIRVMLQPLVHAGVPSTLISWFEDPDFIAAAQQIFASDSVNNFSLTSAQRIKFARLQGALMWRIRGGGLYIKTSGSQTWRDLFTAAPMSTLASLGGASMSWLIGKEFWTGLMQSWGRYFDIGRFPNQEDRFYDLSMMVQIGSRLSELSASDLGARGYDASALRVAGRQFAACYDFAWAHLTVAQWGDRAKDPFVEIANGPTQWAELCAGASFGAAVLQTIAP